MYYLKFFILYSLMGFILESIVYKNAHSSSHSGILHGPYTLVYGIGGVLTLFVSNYINLLNINIHIKLIISYFLFTIICTIVEYVVGNLIYIIFKIEKWNYSNHKYHFGKYICLDYALIWGLLSSIIIIYFKPYFDKIISITSNESIIIISLIIIFDIIYTYKKI